MWFIERESYIVRNDFKIHNFLSYKEMICYRPNPVTLMFLIRVSIHDAVIKWKHFPRYWPFVRGIYRSPVNSTYKGKWRGALMVSLICGWINGGVNNRETGDLRRYRAHYDVTVMSHMDIWNVLLNNSWWFQDEHTGMNDGTSSHFENKVGRFTLLLID